MRLGTEHRDEDEIRFEQLGLTLKPNQRKTVMNLGLNLVLH